MVTRLMVVDQHQLMIDTLDAWLRRNAPDLVVAAGFTTVPTQLQQEALAGLSVTVAVLGTLDRPLPDAHDREGDHRHRGGRDPLSARRPVARRGRQHRRPAALPQRRVTAQSRAARNVSHCWTWPFFRPFMNQRTRCAEEPWVNESGTA